MLDAENAKTENSSKDLQSSKTNRLVRNCNSRQSTKDVKVPSQTSASKTGEIKKADLRSNISGRPEDGKDFSG